ncbi:glucose-6-phosphate isomerase [Lysobacter tyrosinilyticus]
MQAKHRFEQLEAQADRLVAVNLVSMLRADPARATDFALRVGPLYANFSRQGYDRAALDVLFDQLAAVDAPGRVRALFEGEQVNPTEARPALHTALRGNLTQARVAGDAHAEARVARARMREVIERLAAAGVTDIVSVGIGGSDLGPRLAVDALSNSAEGRFRVHFLSNVDGAAMQRMLAGLDPARTAALLISKSFGTQETLLNGAMLRQWLGDDSRLYAISANVERAASAFNIPAERILPMWNWVGGRYSLWSAVGLPIALAIGDEGFDQLLAGAEEMDAHVLNAGPRQNLAAWHALTAIWNIDARGLATQLVMPYDERLKLLPDYLQQLVMESLGKSVKLDGSPVDAQTVPVWWGGVGTDSQHSFFQALHQGTQIVPIDFIGVARGDDPYSDNHAALLSNLLGQAEALANGQASSDPHRVYAGNRPSTMILLDSLTPRSLGALLALYEHSVYLQAVMWDINPFDQFGVELGKQVANRLLPAVRGEVAADDAVTRTLLAELLK